MSTVSSKVRESLMELHAHVDFVFRDTVCHRGSIVSSSVSKKTKFELERLRMTSQHSSGAALSKTASSDIEMHSHSKPTL